MRKELPCGGRGVMTADGCKSWESGDGSGGDESVRTILTVGGCMVGG